MTGTAFCILCRRHYTADTVVGHECGRRFPCVDCGELLARADYQYHGCYVRLFDQVAVDEARQHHPSYQGRVPSPSLEFARPRPPRAVGRGRPVAPLRAVPNINKEAQ